MRESELHREIPAGELAIIINEEMQGLSSETLDAMVQDLLSDTQNSSPFQKAFQELWSENDSDSKHQIQVMAVIHHSSYRDLCIRYSREGKFGQREPGIHDMGNIMASYRQLIKSY